MTDTVATKVARRSAYEAMGESPANVSKRLKEQSDLEGIVVGDETRLRQIVTNLARYDLVCISILLLSPNISTVTPANLRPREENLPSPRN
jgi:hypothetical protein